MGLKSGLKSLGQKASSKLVNWQNRAKSSALGKKLAEAGAKYPRATKWGKRAGLVGAGAAAAGAVFQARLKKKYKVKRLKGGKRRYRGK